MSLSAETSRGSHRQKLLNYGYDPEGIAEGERFECTRTTLALGSVPFESGEGSAINQSPARRLRTMEAGSQSIKTS